MRRLLALGSIVLLPACAGGPDAMRAQELLRQADAAHAQLSTVAYSGKTSFSVQGRSFGFAFSGAAVLKGASAGDQWLRMTSDGIPGVGGLDMSMVRRGDRMTLRSDGLSQEVPIPAALRGRTEAWGSLATMDLGECVKQVDVDEGRSLNGEPASRNAGVVDTACALEVLSGVSGFGQAGALDADQLEEHLDEARVTLFVANRSHLLVGGVLSLNVDAQGEKLRLEVAYRLEAANEPVRFPS